MKTFARATMRTLAAVALAAGLVGCMPVKHSDAEPRQMPNFDDFTAVPVEDFFFSFSKGRYGDFSTPYDITCHFYALPKPNTGPSQEIKCEGAVLPGMDDVPFVSSEQPGARRLHAHLGAPLGLRARLRVAPVDPAEGLSRGRGLYAAEQVHPAGRRAEAVLPEHDVRGRRRSAHRLSGHHQRSARFRASAVRQLGVLTEPLFGANDEPLVETRPRPPARAPTATSSISARVTSETNRR